MRAFARVAYYLAMRPKSGILTVNIEGIKADFYVKNPVALRAVEPICRRYPSGIWGEQLVLKKILDLLKEGDVVYDVGASIGIHTVFTARYLKGSGKVVAFEPEAKSYEALLANISLNKLENVMPLQLALGNSISLGKLHWRGKIVGLYSLIGEEKNDLISRSVEIFPGDYLAEKRRIPFPRVVKIDVEGYEYYVLEGMKAILSREECLMVCCEVHPFILNPEINVEKIIELIKSYGFKRIERSSPGDTFYLFCYKI